MGNLYRLWLVIALAALGCGGSVEVPAPEDFIEYEEPPPEEVATACKEHYPCDDCNPCTADSDDDGCANEPLPDGTMCAKFPTMVCNGGECR